MVTIPAVKVYRSGNVLEAGLPSGAYFLHAAQGSATAVRRFAVMR